MIDRIVRGSLIGLSLLGLVLGLTGRAMAQDSYPSRLVRLIVSVEPGGGTDALARMLSPGVSAILKRTMVVENRPGAGGQIGANSVARAEPDGYNLLIATATALAISPHVENLPYKIADFAPVTLLTRFSVALAVHPRLGVKTIPQLIALAKQKPGALNYSTSGINSPNHLAGELLDKIAGIKTTHIPYKGSGPSVTALLSGEVQMAYIAPQNATQHVQSGNMLVLGLSSAERSQAFVGVPTIAEAGVPGYAVENWLGIVAPARTPAAVIQTLNNAFVTTLSESKIKQLLINQGQDVVGSTPAKFGEVINADYAKFGELLRGLK